MGEAAGRRHGALRRAFESWVEDRRYRRSVRRRLAGLADRECPLCDHRGRFLAAGHPPRYDSRCPSCRSLDRHRLLWVVDQRETLLRPTDRALQFAPEPSLGRYIAGRVGAYASADLEPGRGDLTLNIENVDQPDETYDLVVAVHVLEHVDDQAALREIHRILVGGGRLIAMVPLVDGWAETYEDPTVTRPGSRTVHFGQHDHVRSYGRDFRDRLRAAGFAVDEHTACGADSVRYGLLPGERVFVARKTDGSGAPAAS